MDLGTIQDLLADFGTFGKNIGTAFQYIPELIGNIVDFFTNFNDTADNTEAAFDGLSSTNGETNGNAEAGSSFEGSSEANGETNGEAGSSFEGSSEEEGSSLEADVDADAQL